MLQKIYKLLKNEKGFTFVELIVVMVILGILAAVAIPRFAGRKEEAVATALEADIKIIQNAVDLYMNEYDRVPDMIDLVEKGFILREVTTVIIGSDGKVKKKGVVDP